MAYQSLYRRYRPRRFDEVRGQEHVVRALRNAVRDDRVGHAYLFSGPRGTGKTTSARILAKVLNCERPVDGEPCCECPSCLAVQAGTSYDVHELDAASNNGVDAMRDLIEKTALGTPGRNKVYILDEVHMLSKAAEAALLKTLEEPPPHVVFVLATTDPQKVSETIRSRTQHLQFHLLPSATLADHVRWVAADAGLEVSDEAVEAVLRQGGGSARDTLSALEQVVASGGLTADDEPLDDIVEGLIDADTARALTAVAAASNSGRDARTLTEHLLAQLRDAFLSLMAPALVTLPDRTAARVADQAKRLGAANTVRAMEVLGEILVEMRHAPDPRLLLDVALVRLTNAAADTSPGALVARLERLERAVASGGTVPMPSGAAAPAPAAAAAPAAPATPAIDEPVDDVTPVGVPASVRAAARGAATASAPPPAAAAPPAAAPAARAPIGGRAQLGARAQRPVEPAASAAPAPAPAPAAAPVAAPAAPVVAAPVAAATPPAPAPAGAGGTGLPTRDQLTLAWPDHVLPMLKGMAKARFAAGRFIEGDGTAAVLALPNAPHRDACEPLKGQVEDALLAHFGRAVPLRLVVDGGPPSEGPGGADGPPPPSDPDPGPIPDEPFDMGELVDAPAESPMSAVERVAAAFPGAKLLDDDGRL